jgi:hypothetical protein
MHPADITYPKNATKKSWEAAKKLADKTKKTGLAEKLKTAEAAWAAIPFKSFDVKQSHITDLSSAKAAREVAKAALADEVVKAHTAVEEAGKLAKKQNGNMALSSDAQRVGQHSRIRGLTPRARARRKKLPGLRPGSLL